jgi:hypothetical protein
MRNMKNYFLKFACCLGFSLMAGICYGQFIKNTGIGLTNTTVVISTGEWTNDPGTVILNNGQIISTGGFTNDGLLDPAGTGGFKLDFASDMNFKPGGLKIPSLVKDGAGSALLTGTIHIQDSLLLKNGVISFSNAADTIAISSGAFVYSTPASYVNGLVAHLGNGDLLFPTGTGDVYLPLKIYKIQAARVTASVISAPPGGAGAGVEAMIGFPFAWKVDKKLATDTAAYIEVSYPTTLPSAANPIVVRLIGDTTYNSMGARYIDSTANAITVRSYSRALGGVFSVAKGFPVDPVTDSLALVALFNNTNGAAWLNKTNWIAGPVDSWHGISRSGQTITAIALPSNNLNGAVPAELVDISGLQTVDLSGNFVNSIPDFSGNAALTLDVSGNNLTFQSLEPNAALAGLNYLNQRKFATPLDTLIAVGESYELSLDAGGTNTQYQWKRNGEVLSGATSSAYTILSINRANMGPYIVEATNTLLPALTLQSEIQNVLAYATLSGTLYAETNAPASVGDMTLFKVTTGAYDTVEIKSISGDGTFSFEKVILDDYQLLGFADTLTHPGAIPTYYQNTIFWEEADTLSIGQNIGGLAIISNAEPTPPGGQGIISGYLVEDDGTGRTDGVMAPKRVAGAGVSARRVESSGRGKEEILTLVSYVFTNDSGEFVLNNLPEGEYRLNIQYPGYPMDPNSFITIPIGSALESIVQVEANVAGDKIVVEKLLITGIYEATDYKAEVYPNPAADFIHLKFANTSAQRNAVMRDITGKTVFENSAEMKEVQLNVRNLQKGIYLLNIVEKGRIVKTMKVSIE